MGGVKEALRTFNWVRAVWAGAIFVAIFFFYDKFSFPILWTILPHPSSPENLDFLWGTALPAFLWITLIFFWSVCIKFYFAKSLVRLSESILLGIFFALSMHLYAWVMDVYTLTFSSRGFAPYPFFDLSFIAVLVVATVVLTYVLKYLRLIGGRVGSDPSER